MYLNSVKEGKADTERQGCVDCVFMKGYINWWCTNKDAIAWRRTAIPGVVNCKFWEPAPEYKSLPWYKRWFGDYL